ncbi:MAG TPA: FAD-dependent oxidoreductase [Candidatus Saccharimonadales bacterium]|jgi:ferredoxin-NADP reductase
MRARFVKQEWENQARTIASLYFSPVPGQPAYRYEAGQYASIVVPHSDIDSRGDSRTMTLSSSPTQDLLKISLKVFNDDGSSFKRALLALRPGDEIIIYDAMGDLILPLDASIPLLFVAGGIGIASYTGMTQYLLDTKDTRNITLLYTVARLEDIALQSVFDAYNEQSGLTRRIITPDVKPVMDTTAGTGKRRLASSDIMQHYTSDTQIYLSGVESMVEQFHTELIRDYHVPPHQIVFDYFEGYSEL